MRRVLVLGCGPAGLMVAHAAELNGWDFQVYSNKQKSQLFGAQYLHDQIPGIECGLPKTVRYSLRGTPEQYRRKVYGPGWDGTVSPEDYEDDHYAWDIRLAYEQLWDIYGDEIVDCEIKDKESLKQNGVDLVVSTVPRKIWAEPGDVFESQKIWALGDANEQRVYLYRGDEFTVICDGTVENEWYRVSNIFGYCTMEWPGGDWGRGPGDSYMTPPARGASIVEKPLRHNSTAASDIVHLGRFGKWEKGVLTTDAFHDAMKLFSSNGL